MDWFQRLTIIVTLTGGTVMLMWFGELITEHGIGNGISLIIFAGIIGRAPRTIITTIQGQGGGLQDYVPFILFGVVALLLTAGIIEVHQAVPHIPLQPPHPVASRRRTLAARPTF